MNLENTDLIKTQAENIFNNPKAAIVDRELSLSNHFDNDEDNFEILLAKEGEMNPDQFVEENSYEEFYYSQSEIDEKPIQPKNCEQIIENRATQSQTVEASGTTSSHDACSNSESVEVSSSHSEEDETLNKNFIVETKIKINLLQNNSDDSFDRKEESKIDDTSNKNKVNISIISMLVYYFSLLKILIKKSKDSQ